MALDVDPEAVATADENLALNRVATVAARVGSLGDVPGGNDLVLANIEASVLVPLAPEFPARVAPGGALILSGLLTSDVDADHARLPRRRLRHRRASRRRRMGRAAPVAPRGAVR